MTGGASVDGRVQCNTIQYNTYRGSELMKWERGGGSGGVSAPGGWLFVEL